MSDLGTVPALAEEARERAIEIEAARRLPADFANRLAGAGLFSMFVPRAYGGGEVSARVGLEAIETLAMGDASVAWCAMIGATTAFTSAFLEPEAARAIYGKPGTITGGVFAPKGKARLENGAYAATGRWQWASGSANCDFLMGGCVIEEDGDIRRLPNGAPESRMLIFPRAAVTLHDTWQVMGLAGTGSGDMSVDEVRVDPTWSVSLVSDPLRVDGPLYRFPLFGMLAMGVSAVALGNARGALDELIEFGDASKRQYSSLPIGGGARAQLETAEAVARLEGARAFLFGTLETVWDKAVAGEAPSLEDRARLRLAATHATRSAALVAQTCFDIAGGASAFLSFPIQRRFRDAQVATQHIMVAPSTLELAGRVLYGLETDATFL